MSFFEGFFVKIRYTQIENLVWVYD